MPLTFLGELEAISDVALVCYEQEATLKMGCFRGSFNGGDLRPERNTRPNDTMDFGRARTKAFKVTSGIGLAGVCCERAPVLGLLVIGKSVLEVVIAEGIFRKGRVIFQWNNIDGRSWTP